MVDLSQNQPPKQKSASGTPVGDKPPVDQPATQPKKQFFTSASGLKDEEKIVTPKQEKIKKELSELGIAPPGSSNRTKILLATLGVILLVATLPAAVYLVKQRQEIRKEAYPGQTCTTTADCSGANEVCSNRTCVCASGYVERDGACVRETPAEICTGGVDEDGDGKTDCEDPDCADDPACQVTGLCPPGKTADRDPSLPGPTECAGGYFCHDSEYNYCCWDQDGNEQWTPGVDACTRGNTADVYCDGHCIVFKNMQDTQVTFLKYYSNQNVSCPYGPGSPSTERITIPSNNWQICIPPGKCGQLEADGYTGCCKDTGCEDGNGNGEKSDCNEPPGAYGCKAGLTVYQGVCRNPACPEETDCECPPPPGCYDACANDAACTGDLVCQNSICVNADCPQESNCICEAQCEYCKVFDENWNEITDLSTIKVGQTIYFATFGSTTHAQGITKARFRINGGDWIETTDRHQNMFYIEYVIPDTGSYTIESMVYNPGLGWY